jgi:hypothetical protein
MSGHRGSSELIRSSTHLSSLKITSNVGACAFVVVAQARFGRGGGADFSIWNVIYRISLIMSL